jgi:uncharacterized protein YPO0396
MESMLLQKNSLGELQIGIINYREKRRMVFLEEDISSLTIKAEGVEGEISRRLGLLENRRSVQRELEQQHREMGGDRIEDWENNKRILEEQRTDRLRRRDNAAQTCRELGWTLGETPQEFSEVVGKAREEIDGLENRHKAARDELLIWGGKKNDAVNAFSIANREVKALQSQPSNIPAAMLDMRHEIASAIGISDSALPFVGELVEVKPNESLWQGAIERVLHGFAMSILVDERNYSALSNYINNTHIGWRLFYFRTGRTEQRSEKPLNADSMVLKLNVKDGNYSDWLKADLRQRFDYACVESVQAFRAVDRALTREGQVKHSKTRHEKDDRRSINDRRDWVLGFDNHEKLALFQQQAQEQALIISECEKKINALSDQDNEGISRAMHCKTLVNLQWQEIDVVPLLERISNIEKLIREAREGNNALQEIARQITEQEALVSQAEDDLGDIKARHKSLCDKIKEDKEKFDGLKNDPSIVPLTPHQQKGLDERYERVTSRIRLDNLSDVTTTVVQALNKEAGDIERTIAE